MIIITADDYGKNARTTDSILQCFAGGKITSASAMVFMEDSGRAASLSMNTGMEVGLHLNYTMPFSMDTVSPKLRDHHSRVVSYLGKNKFSQIIYNPLLAESFSILFKAQQEEFIRLYGRQPDFYNGHHHMHLCANVLAGKLIPTHSRVRGTYTFDQGEKNILNRFYRHVLDMIVSRRFISTDSFFSILPLKDSLRLTNIFNRSLSSHVELEVHPENADEIEFLFSDQFRQLLDSVHIGNFQKIPHGH